MAAGIHGTEHAATAPTPPRVTKARGGERPSGAKSQRGVAIIMVVLILAALISIAGPFAISMHLYERSSRHFRDTVRARLAAEGAVAHAISSLRRTEDAAEAEARYGPPWNTPDFDTQEELDVYFSFGGTIDEELKKAGIRFDDPRGVMWSARVEDEQGKINLISAAPRVLGNLLRSDTLVADTAPGASVLVLEDASLFDNGDEDTPSEGKVCIEDATVSYSSVSGDSLEGLSWLIPPDSRVRKYTASTLVYDAAAQTIAKARTRRDFKTLFELKQFISPRLFETVQPYVTVNSYRDESDGWLRYVEVEGGFSALTKQFRVRSVAGFGQGARVEFSSLDPETGVRTYQTTKCIFWARQQGQYGYFRLYTFVGFNPPEGEVVHVRAEQFHPVNVNTASPPVLMALLAGLGEGRRHVTRLEAEHIADYIYYYVRGDETQVAGGQPVGSHADFRAMMEKCRTSGWIADGIARAKIDAINQDATATICFKAYGNFTIEAAGSVNTRAGEESARHVIRQLVTMPVDSGGRWSISSQKDFDEQVGRLVGPKTDTWPFSEPPTSGSALDVYKRGINPATGRDENGYVTLATGWAGGSQVAHFDKMSPMWQGAYLPRHGAARLAGGTLKRAGSSVFEKSGDIVKPFTFEGWFRVEGGGGGNGLGLSAGGANRNGLRLAYTTAGLSGNPEYVLTVADACADQGNVLRPWCGPAEFRFEAPRMDPGDWYHLATQVKGTSPGEALVWVDGVVSRGRPSSYRPGTRLAQSLPLIVAEIGDDDDLLSEGETVYVDDTSAFPDRGAIIINGEVMEYWKKTQTTFEKCRRARRYTHLAEHQTGTIVTPYGYSVPLATDLFSGTGKLASELGPNPVSTIPARMLKVLGGGPPVEDVVKDTDTEIPLVSTADFQDSGIVRIGSEYVFFRSIDRVGHRLLGCEERGYDIDEDNKSDAAEYPMNGTVVVRQITIACTGMEGFTFFPQLAWGRPNRDKQLHSEKYHYASVKHDDADDNDSDDFEWFRLEHKVERDNVTYVLGAKKKEKSLEIRNNLNWRNQLGTTKRALRAGTPVLPVVQLAGPQCGHEDSPRGSEEVTPVQGGRAEDTTLLVSHSNHFQYRWSRSGPESCYYVFRASFDKPITGSTYSSSGGRILKFPSGEFMRKIPSSLKVGGANGGSFFGMIDELRTDSTGAAESNVVAAIFNENELPFTPTEPTGLLSNETTITLMAEMATDGSCSPTNTTPGVSEPLRSQGVVKIGDELIWYGSKGQKLVDDTKLIPWGREQRTNEKFCPYFDDDNHNDNCRRRMQTITLNDCVRGILGTDMFVSDHAAGARVTFFEAIPLTVLTDALPKSGDYLRIQSGDTFPAEGYAIISAPSERASPGRGEIVGWTEGGGTSFKGCEFLRGRYGTPERGHYGGDFCQLLPFRYWDRWNYDFDNEAELAYFQCSYSARDAFWQEIEWQESGYTGGAASDRVRLRIVCRFDGKPDWNARPTNSQGGLWEFTGGGRQEFRSAGGGPLIADSIEVRAYWEYLSGAWDVDVNDWKRNVRLDNLTVTFGSPLIVRKVDLLDY